MSLKRPILVQISTTLKQYQHMLLIGAKRRGLRWTPECFDSFCFFCLLIQKGKFLIQTLIEEPFYRTVFLTVWKKFSATFCGNFISKQFQTQEV